MSFINTKDVIGSQAALDGLIDGTLEEFNDDTITSIANYAFYNNTGIESVNMPSVTSIGTSSFEGCTSLSEVSFQAATGVGGSAFKNSGLTEVTETQFPSLTTVSTGPFAYMPSIARVFLPGVAVGQFAFRDCVALRTAVIGWFINTYSFYNCSALQSADMSLNSVQTHAFNACSSLTTLVLRSSSVQWLNDLNAFNGTPFASGGSGGTIYVPSALIDTYKSATNWSTLNGYGTVTWAAIEGSQYENYYADGTPIE